MRSKIISSWVAFAFVFLALFLLSGSMVFKKQAAVGTLGVPLIGQGMNEWCWAACTEMVSLYYHNKDQRSNIIKQCVLVKDAYSLDSLPCDGSHRAVEGDDKQGQPFQQDTTYNFNDWEGELPLPYAALDSEISAGRPVIFQWGFFGVTYAKHLVIGKKDYNLGGHWLVAEGCPVSAHSDSLWVAINDPLPVGEGRHQVMSYSAFAGCIPSPVQLAKKQLAYKKTVFYSFNAAICQIHPKIK